MTLVEGEYYYSIDGRNGYVFVNIYRKRANPKWYQKKFEYLDRGSYLPAYDLSPHDRAIKTVEKIIDEYGGMSEKKWAKSLNDKTMRKV